MKGKKFVKIFFATDVHGSERCFNKFLSAAKFYKSDVLVLGGDITGKMLIPIVDVGDGTFSAEYLGKQMVLRTPEEIRSLEQAIADSGYYYYHCNKSEMDDLRASKEKVDKVFTSIMKQNIAKWVELAEKVLSEIDVTCYITGGNDDAQEVVDEIRDTTHVKNADHRVINIDGLHEMLNLGWSNPTPWKCPRDHSEQDLEDALLQLASAVSDMSNCVFNVHTPPINSGLDECPKLDDSVYPPKRVLEKGQPVLFGAGSESVRRIVEKYQPLVHLCGHIHESKGMTKIGRTLVLNPGSEYGEGVLRGALVNIADKKVLSWQLTSG